MTQRAPVRSRQNYRHEAYLWRDPADFTDTMVSFIEEGLDAGEPVMVAVTPQHTRWLHQTLSGSAADRVEFVDMARLGGNPARIIPAWQRFVGPHSEPVRPVRGIGEPIWPGRHPEELLECQLHEALLNVAIDPDLPLWLICPYDADTLSQAVVEEAHRSHPVIVEAGTHRGSALYAGRAHVDGLFAADLSPPTGPYREVAITPDTLNRLPAYAKLELYLAGLPIERAGQIAIAVKRLARDSLRRGSSSTTIRIWNDPDALTCEVADDITVTDPLLGRSVHANEHQGLWEANQVCDLVQLRSTPTRTIIRILTWTRHNPGPVPHRLNGQKSDAPESTLRNTRIPPSSGHSRNKTHRDGRTAAVDKKHERPGSD